MTELRCSTGIVELAFHDPENMSLHSRDKTNLVQESYLVHGPSNLSHHSNWVNASLSQCCVQDLSIQSFRYFLSVWVRDASC